MKTHLKTHKIRLQIGFYGDTELLEPNFGLMLLEWVVGWEKLGQATTWSTVCMLKTHKTHFKTHKIGFYRNCKSPILNFWAQAHILGSRMMATSPNIYLIHRLYAWKPTLKPMHLTVDQIETWPTCYHPASQSMCLGPKWGSSNLLSQ